MTDDIEVQAPVEDAPPVLMRTHVMNSTQTSIEVPIVNPDTGEKDSVFLQPGGKPYLPQGFVPDPVWLRFNPRVKTATVPVPDAGLVLQPESE